MRNSGNQLRLKLDIGGAVQGVGFRPFIFRTAAELALRGFVQNSAGGVTIEVEGPEKQLREFLCRVPLQKPPRSYITSLESAWLDPIGLGTFEIVESAAAGTKTSWVLPDIATCPECLEEIFDPVNRRFLYPFTNCVNCGPRFSIIEALPYDRKNTSMRSFEMCPDCRREYDNPMDRRFHAQPNACPVCGPHLELWDADGSVICGGKSRDAAGTQQVLQAAAAALKGGKVVALKGLGGFHLMVDAGNSAAVQQLRARKRREEKPFAVMFPSLQAARSACEVSEEEAALLLSPQAPIVLLPKKPAGKHGLSPELAPGNPSLGLMLPYTPLHHMLLREIGGPVVATSGNLSDEPICTDEQDALERLKGIADLFLVHNRPIVRHVDDSVARFCAGRAMLLRRARGYAPLPISLKQAAPQPVLAFGAHLKNAVAFANGVEVFISQHIGDLETEAAYRAFRSVVSDLPALYEVQPRCIVSDAHPDYVSTTHASERAAALGLRPRAVQHHVAHVLSCMAENEVAEPALGVAWDGTGFGLDSTIWGGEFFTIESGTWKRVAHLRQFRLPGGEAAVKEPRRSALGLLHACFGQDFIKRVPAHIANSFALRELPLFETLLQRGVNAPITSSMGRLFDAVAALVGLRPVTRHEGQAAMDLEFSAKGRKLNEHYPAALARSPRMLVLDWEPMVRSILEDIEAKVPAGEISAKFHSTLAQWVVAVAREMKLTSVALSGGCFQNRLLLELCIERLRSNGFNPYWHQRVPPNDGGIALGQIAAMELSEA